MIYLGVGRITFMGGMELHLWGGKAFILDLEPALEPLLLILLAGRRGRRGRLPSESSSAVSLEL